MDNSVHIVDNFDTLNPYTATQTVSRETKHPDLLYALQTFHMKQLHTKLSLKHCFMWNKNLSKKIFLLVSRGTSVQNCYKRFMWNTIPIIPKHLYLFSKIIKQPPTGVLCETFSQLSDPAENQIYMK